MEELGVLTLSESDWTEAKHRGSVIGPLAELSTVGRVAAEEAAAKLGISTRMVYALVNIASFHREENLLVTGKT